MTKHQRNIKNYLVNPSFQMRFAFNFVIGFLVAMAITHSYLFYQLNSFIEDFSLHYPVQSDFHLQLHDLFTQLIVVTVLTIGVATVALFVMSINLSHKIAGPAYVLHSTIEKMLNEDYDIRANLREGDELNEVYESLAKLADKYRKQSKDTPS